jgi:hypothetical protein
LHLHNINIKNKRLFYYGYKILSKINSLRNTPKIKEYKIQVKNINFFDDQADDLWNEIKEYYNYAVVRNKEYLNWRYCDPRGGNYFKKAAYEKGKLIGYIVLRINSKNKVYPVGNIVDLFTLPKRQDIIIKLVSESITFFDDNSVNVCSLQNIQNHPNEEILHRFGFVRIPHEWRVVFRKQFISNKEFQLIKNSSAKRIHFSYGDHDWI